MAAYEMDKQQTPYGYTCSACLIEALQLTIGYSLGHAFAGLDNPSKEQPRNRQQCLI